MNESDPIPYAEAVRAHEVAMSLRWISILLYYPDKGLWSVKYVGKLAA